jgi:hypothetical protein
VLKNGKRFKSTILDTLEYKGVQNMAKTKKSANFKVDSQTASRLRLLSEKSGYSVAYLLREFSIIADTIPNHAEKISLVMWTNPEKKVFRTVVCPIICGSIPVNDDFPNSMVDELVHADMAKKMKTRSD